MQLQAVASDKEHDASHRWELQNKLYFMAGKFQRIPAGWSFPQGTTAVMWLGWVCPDEAHGVSPLSCFTSMDMNHLTQGKKKLSELKWLMKMFEDAGRVKGLWKDVFTPAEANHVYIQIFDSITKERLAAKGGLR